MSRTFRCRYLPVVRGSRCPISARRISDGARAFSWLDIRKAAEAEVTKLYGPRPEVYSRVVHIKGLTHKAYPWHAWMSGTPPPPPPPSLPGRIMKTWETWAWEQAVYRTESEMVLPISNWHPLRRHEPVGSRKKYGRVSANRAARRCTRQLLRSVEVNEDWEGHFPGHRDYFDWWSIY